MYINRPTVQASPFYEKMLLQGTLKTPFEEMIVLIGEVKKEKTSEPIEYEFRGYQHRLPGYTYTEPEAIITTSNDENEKTLDMLMGQRDIKLDLEMSDFTLCDGIIYEANRETSLNGNSNLVFKIRFSHWTENALASEA